MDPRRYQGWTTPEWCEAKIKETYTLNNAINYGGFENRPAGRDTNIHQTALVPMLTEARK
jgi:hypothetical protein